MWDRSYRESISFVQGQVPIASKIYLSNVNPKPPTMTLPFIAIGLIAVFIIYVVYLAFVKKDLGKLKSAIFPGLFFLAIWAIIYYFLLK